MPTYDFKHEESGEILSIYVGLKEPDEARKVQVVDGKTYMRTWDVPYTATDSITKEGTPDDFKRATTGKNLTMGQVWEMSAEMAKKRADRNGGHDHVTEGYYEKYEKKMGKPHDDIIKRRKREQQMELSKALGIRVED